MRIGEAELGGAAEPLRRRGHVARRADALGEGVAETERGVGVALRRGLAIPLQRLRRILDDAEAVLAQYGIVVLRLGDAALGGGAQQRCGARIILVDALAQRVERAQPVIRQRIAGLGAWLEPRGELPRIGRLVIAGQGGRRQRHVDAARWRQRHARTGTGRWQRQEDEAAEEEQQR